MINYFVTITKVDQWDESYDIWAKSGSAPLEIGDGYYVGNFPILPNETSIIATAGVPTTGDWGFLVAPVYRRESVVCTKVAP